MALCEACETDMRKILDLNTSESFDSVELNVEFRRIGLDSFQNRTNDEPPSKRRRIKETDLLDEITADLYSLLGSQQVTDLDGLSQVAE
jgi:hypothetical protein